MTDVQSAEDKTPSVWIAPVEDEAIDASLTRPITLVVPGADAFARSTEPAFEEILYTGNRVDSVTHWTEDPINPAADKIREDLFTYSGNQIVTEIINQYDSTPAIVETLTGTYSYTGNRLDDIDWVLT